MAHPLPPPILASLRSSSVTEDGRSITAEGEKAAARRAGFIWFYFFGAFTFFGFIYFYFWAVGTAAPISQHEGRHRPVIPEDAADGAKPS